MQNTFDYIVVGAGTAGCLLANRLSGDPTKRVLLLEAGGKDNYHWIHIPVGYLYCIDNPRTDWLYRTQEEIGLNGRSLIYPRGRVLGGCSSINGMIYMRGQARDYDHWANVTGENKWSWDDCLNDFKKHEDNYRLNGDIAGDVSGETEDKMHASGGEWRVEQQRLKWNILDAYAKAANQAGIAATDDFNSGDNTGTGYFEVNQKSGWRWNSSKAFLRSVKHRKNLEIWTHAQVEKLSLEEQADGKLKCTGAQLNVKGRSESVIAKNEVILSAGAIGSPTILQHSGIGDGFHLKSHGVEVKHNLIGVGNNLQDHLQLRTIYKVEGAKTLNEMANTLWGKAKIGLEYALKRTGPMSMAPSQLGLFTKSDANQEHSNIQFHVQPLSLEAFGEPLHPWAGITASVCNLNPTSRGSVMIGSNKPMDAPVIAPNYLSTQEDKKVAANSIRVARNIAKQSALAQYNPQEIKPGPSYNNDEELAEAAGNIGTTIFHPVGTAKMGKSTDKTAVVDSHLRVFGVSGLRVVDASIMPSITSGNTNSPTLMIAEKAAAWIVAEN